MLRGLSITLTVFGLVSVSLPVRSEEAKFIRQALHEFVGVPGKIDALRRGVAEMKRRNAAPKDSAEYRTSWEYWAAIHGCLGEAPCAGTLTEVKDRYRARFPSDFQFFESFFDGLIEAAPPDDLARRIWATCTHGSPGNPHPQFLTWHRMYLFWFERVLRKASGDPTLALPYWDYTNPVAHSDDLFASPWRPPLAYLCPPTRPCDNPLWEARRTGSFGLQVHIDPTATSIDTVLDQGTVPDFLSFQSNIETGIHAHIHCAVGNGCRTPYLGVVPFAANDILFWHHHANIDRLWECWRHSYGREAPLEGEWLDQKYRFVDENGAEVTMAVQELFEDGRIDYTYDNVTACLRKREKPPSTTSALEQGRLIRIAGHRSSAGEVRLTALRQSEELPGGRLPPLTSAQNFELVIRRVAKAVLTLEGLRYETPPPATILISLVDAETNGREFVSQLGFFSTEAHEHGGAPHAPVRPAAATYDVTSQFSELIAKGADPDRIQVEFLATTGLTGSNTEVSPTAYAGAKLTFKDVRLEYEVEHLKVE